MGVGVRGEGAVRAYCEAGRDVGTRVTTVTVAQVTEGHLACCHAAELLLTFIVLASAKADSGAIHRGILCPLDLGILATCELVLIFFHHAVTA